MNISTKKNKQATLFHFTMVELIAVISVMAILLSISIKAMKTDSTSTNVLVLGSTLKYAQTYAMSSLRSTQTLEVEVSEDRVTINLIDGTNTTLLKEEKLATGSKITNIDNPSPQNIPATFTFDKNGKPDTNSATVFTITDNKDEDGNNKQTVTLRAFTGKVIYY